MAADLDRAIQSKRDAESYLKDAESNLADNKEDLAAAETEVRRVRDDMYAQYPELMPEQLSVSEAATPDPVPSPQGGLVFRELDDDPMGQLA